MPLTPAVCPACGRVIELDARALPPSLPCPGCGGLLAPRAMGAAVLLEPHVAKPAEKEEVTALLARAEKAEPEQQFELISQALALDPLSFQANRALLLLGELYQRRKRIGDFSMFKSYLLHMFEEPQQYPGPKLDKLREDLLAHPQLKRTLVLCGDQDAFMDEYFLALARQYVDLFIAPRTSISHSIFGFAKNQEAVAKGCAQVVQTMLDNVKVDSGLTDAQKAKLGRALRGAFAESFPGRGGLLQQS